MLSVALGSERSEVKVAQLYPTLCDPVNIQSMGFSRLEKWSGSCSLLQGIFPTQESNLGLLHCRQILYRLSYEGSPIIKDAKDLRCYHTEKDYVLLCWDSF